MLINNNSPLNHLAACALAFTAGVITTLAWCGYGLYMRRLSRRDTQDR
jgi:hypothetical protein